MFTSPLLSYEFINLYLKGDKNPNTEYIITLDDNDNPLLDDNRYVIVKEVKKRIPIRTQEYNVVVTHYDDGTFDYDRTNKGFNIFELLGVLNNTIIDVNNQFLNISDKPKVVNKSVVI